MHRERLFLILLVVSYCGCDTQTSAPVATAVEAGDRPNTGHSLAPVEPPSPVTADSASNGDDQYVSFPAAGVKLVRPDGFDDAENFHGFQQPSTHSSVMVVAVPGPFLVFANGFTAEQLKTRGMNFKSKEKVEIAGIEGLLINVTQSASGIEFAKWIAAFGDEKETKMIVATFPIADEAKLSAQLKSAILRTRPDASPRPTPGADVGFTIEASDTMKLTTGVGKMLAYSKDGVLPAKSPEDPLFIAAPSISTIPVADKRKFSVQRLFQTAHTKITSVTTTNEITIDGLDGYELLADAEDAESRTPLVVYQVILFDKGSYILIQGIVGATVASDYVPGFKAMARSLSRQRK